MAPPYLTLKNIHLTFGGTPLLTGADLTVAPGERLCLVGRNGSGKSTLLKIAAGLVEPDNGERFVHPGAVIRYLAQEANFDGHETTRSFVEAGLKPTDDRHEAMMALYALGLTGEESTSTLSGGEARRAAIAQALAAKPDVLLLDEPTNHLDLPAIEWIEKELAGVKAALVLISHDRRFLERLSKETVWLDRGKTRRLDQGFGGFEAWRDKLIEEEEAELHKLDRKIAREQQWMHGGVTGRRKRNVRRVKELAAMRQQRREHRHVQGDVNLEVSDGQVSGKLVIEALGISKSFGGTPIVSDLSLRVLRGDRLGIVGPNGAGKTTLIRLLTGQMEPDAGTVRLGSNLDIVTLDQKREDLDPEMMLSDSLTGGRGDQVIINGKPRHVSSYMKDFLFLPEQIRSQVKVLSGGERGRLMLARALSKQSNFLILDEPTNDLDLETLDLLQDLLADYAGTVILVSHDRDFLDRVVTSVLAPDGDGVWREYAGGYSDMIAQRKGEAPRKASAAEGQPTAAAESKPGKAASKARPTSKAGGTGTPGKQKLSYKEKFALESIPKRIDELQASIARFEAKLAEPDVFTKDPDGFEAASTGLADAQAELAGLEDQWLELEMKREEFEGG
ncbi:MAG: ATP-binding cassette domain-containing protein [Alphaproteobacteria bacterium]|nr:ATP-binding cassette domain-containing protein [Alphaproteobacteria bacterium]